jgi:hypothetical protein
MHGPPTKKEERTPLMISIAATGNTQPGLANMTHDTGLPAAKTGAG